MKIDLSIIIVNYNTKTLLKDCVVSILRNCKDVGVEVIVVDNASTDGSSEMLRKEFPSVVLIENRNNLGFSKANNLGIKCSRGGYVLLLNSDTLIINNCLEEIESFMNNNKNIGLLGCRVNNEDQSLQFSCYNQPTLITELVFFGKNIIKDFWDPITFYKNMGFWDHDKVKEVDCIAGCFLWIRKDVFNKIGLLKENFFMYYEDAEFCWRLKRESNYKIVYYPHASITHLKGKSSDRLSVTTIRYSAESAIEYFKICYGECYCSFFKFLVNIVWSFEIICLYPLKFLNIINQKVFLLNELKKVVR